MPGLCFQEDPSCEPVLERKCAFKRAETVARGCEGCGVHACKTTPGRVGARCPQNLVRRQHWNSVSPDLKRVKTRVAVAAGRTPLPMVGPHQVVAGN